MAIAYIAACGVLIRLHRDRLRAHLNVAATLGVVAVIGLALIAARCRQYVTSLQSARNF
jgi:hypothetical protein